MDSRRWGVRAILLWGVFSWIVFGGVARAGQKTPPAPAQAAGYAGQDTCLTCHADKGKVYGATAHGHPLNPRAPAAQHGCESCHGPGQAHADAGGDKTKIRSLKGMSAAEINETCETCHNRGRTRTGSAASSATI